MEGLSGSSGGGGDEMSVALKCAEGMNAKSDYVHCLVVRETVGCDNLIGHYRISD